MQDFLERLLKALHARAIVVIADTDFAGTISRRASHEYIRGPGKNLLPVDHLLQVICSSSSNEICWESDNYKRSVFTHALITSLKADRSAPLLQTAWSIHDLVRDEVNQSHHRPQNLQTHASIYGSSGLLDFNLATLPLTPRPAPAP
jgi:hypothetical protein